MRSTALLGRGASAHSRPRVPTTDRSALLVRLRRLGVSRGTQGNAEAEAAAAVLRRAPEPVRRPANRGRAAPTAATEHTKRAP
jgi:hypothetical protein